MSVFLAYLSACLTALSVIAPFVILLFSAAAVTIIFIFSVSSFRRVIRKGRDQK